ncbi:hypothetical protein [Enhygromyxa salina]|uniref:hypothetical protein n=1 Tax=Enhygromyxa salina TaxID=215803 RepID=UPI0011B1CDEA|nr:hypothetical protein [Enhygromyxa salina]
MLLVDLSLTLRSASLATGRALQAAAFAFAFALVFALVACPSAEQSREPAPPSCFEVVQWLGPEICNWAAHVTVSGCIQADSVDLRYSFASYMPCGPDEQVNELRYGHGDLDWEGRLAGACPSELRRLLVPEPSDSNSDLFVSLLSDDGTKLQTWRSRTDWRLLLRELDFAAKELSGWVGEPLPSPSASAHGETLTLQHEPTICSVTLTHERAGERTSCTMPSSDFRRLVEPNADAWWYAAEVNDAMWTRLRDAADCSG